MAVASRDKFIASVTKSNVIAREKLDAWLASVDDEDPKAIASKFVRDKLLTLWQAKFLLSGRSRLNVGNYVLQSRISSDELGDKFEAIHTQLNRQVVIQFFPTSIADDAALLKKLMKKLRQITELDHPNLIHVYDVDQESDRFFLVTEYVEGTTLSSIPPDQLTEIEIARIIDGIAAGLTDAHQSKIIHGNLSSDNIIVTRKGKAKLQGFPSATLIGETKSTDGKVAKFSENDDFKRLVKIGGQLLKRIPQTDRSDQFRTLSKFIFGLSDLPTRPKSIKWLNDWIIANEVADAGGPPDAEFSESPSIDSSANPQSSIDIPDFEQLASLDQIANADSRFKSKVSVKPKASAKPSANPSAKLKSSAKSSSKFRIGQASKHPAKSSASRSTQTSPQTSTQPATKNRSKLIAIATVTILLASGVLGALGYALVNHGGGSEVAVSDRSQSAETQSLSTENDLEIETDAISPKEKPVPASKQQSTNGNTAKQKPKRRGNEKKANDASTVGNIAAASAVNDDDNNGLKKSRGNQTKPTVVKNSRANTQEKNRGPAIDSKPVPSSPPSQLVKNNQPSPTPKPARVSRSFPLDKFPELVDLPSAATTSDQKLGNLTIDSNYLLGLELLAEPIVGRGKVDFQMERSAQDKQLWNVTLAPKQGDPIAVAQFQKTEDKMLFRWLPAAAENEEANYLRNGLIRLFTPKESHWVGLRTPVTVRGFKIEKNGTTAKLDVDVDWLPNSQAMKIQLEPFRTGLKDDDVGFSPREITPKDNGRIFFRKKTQDRFFFVEVSVDTGRKLSFEAQMKVLLPDGTPQRIRSIADLEAFSKAIANEKKKADFQNAEIKKAKKPKNTDAKEWRKFKAEAAKTVREISKALEVSQAYPEVAKNLGGKEIPVSIYFDMDGQRIILAKSK